MLGHVLVLVHVLVPGCALRSELKGARGRACSPARTGRQSATGLRGCTGSGTSRVGSYGLLMRGEETGVSLCRGRARATCTTHEDEHANDGARAPEHPAARDSHDFGLDDDDFEKIEFVLVPCAAVSWVAALLREHRAGWAYRAQRSELTPSRGRACRPARTGRQSARGLPRVGPGLAATGCMRGEAGGVSLCRGRARATCTTHEDEDEYANDGARARNTLLHETAH